MIYHKLLIAGPCAAESQEQVMAIAAALQPLQPIFRAGLWKPRSNPQSFQGVGAEGLKWLQQVKQHFGCEVATEVATTEHIRLCLDAKTDYLWIGARTATNPIVIQQLADTLASYDTTSLKGILVKNPMNEDAKLWIGNIQRFSNALKDSDIPVLAVLRGCNHHPCWDMAYQLRSQLPSVPLLLDPSHMAGMADKVAPLCCQSAELEMDGLMVETHTQPEQALSDAQQQITPQQLLAIIQSLPSPDRSVPLSLRWLRAMMDEVDEDLWLTIRKRMEISRRIGEVKREEGMQIIQKERFEHILNRRLQWAQENDISPQTIKDIYNALHKESIRKQ